MDSGNYIACGKNQMTRCKRIVVGQPKNGKLGNRKNGGWNMQIILRAASSLGKAKSISKKRRKNGMERNKRGKKWKQGKKVIEKLSAFTLSISHSSVFYELNQE
ncbi:hypothetical protein BB560_004379 [Smittium megazygosporum]|uniref:Uncharacterized protein n=1 Tax=Smittium megazygosporum TaxID=133381 RepID=A0A2T9Z9E1_9FUNG|nr:hypothetical protein BB560_004379 [Smittium megazygosporum]